MAELTKEEEQTDWYDVLGLEVDVDDGAITKAFKKLSLKWHPDKNQGSKAAHEMFMRVKEAKNFLLDVKKRRTYDEKRAERRRMETLLAERNRNMGQRRRQLQEELERREKGMAGGGLGAGGEARMEAARREAKLEELKKAGEALREKRSREQKAAWESARASAKRKNDPVGGKAQDDDLEERTVRVKWKRKESHSDYTLDVLFSRFGTVESVSIQAGSGNKALVTFSSSSAVEAAVAAYEENETMRVSFVGKKRPKRSAFASRPETTPSAAVPAPVETRSFRDHESLVMMKMRQAAERQALMRRIAEEEGLPGEKQSGADESTGANRGNSSRSNQAVAEGSNNEMMRERVHDTAASPNVGSSDDTSRGQGSPVDTIESRSYMAGKVEGVSQSSPAVAAPSAGKGIDASAEWRSKAGTNSGSMPTLTVPQSRISPRWLHEPIISTLGARESTVFSAMMEGAGSQVTSGANRASYSTVNAGTEGIRCPVKVAGDSGGTRLLDEGDILSRMMQFNK